MAEKKSTQKRRFITIPIEDVSVGELLPGDIYIFLGNKFVAFRGKEDAIDRAAYERLEQAGIETLFILDADKTKFAKWSDFQSEEPVTPREEIKNLPKVREQTKLQVLELFQSPDDGGSVETALVRSKRLVAEVMKAPYASKILKELQTLSKSSADHAMNVSILSVYLAQHMGYSHKGILQNVGAGALFHDIGKTKIKIEETDTEEEIELKMKDHPRLGAELLEKHGEASQEVRMIVAQHHECFDGTGYPKKLKGTQIYELARIVSIANAFDDLVSNGQGTLRERQKYAIEELESTLRKKFDHNKLFKVIKILQWGM